MASESFSTIVDRDGEAFLFKHFIVRNMADSLFLQMKNELRWQHETIKIFGRQVEVPRLIAWYGDTEAVYTYSDRRHIPLPWNQVLNELHKRLEKFIDASFNSVLCNFYRNGQDSMGWHKDNEPELGKEPVIASLSFGAGRDFVLKHKDNTKVSVFLESGDLLLMRGKLQQYWRHCVPKRVNVTEGRINLTWRYIFPAK